MRVAIITANTDIYRGNEENAGGEAIKEIVEEMGCEITFMRALPLDREVLSTVMQRMADNHLTDLLLTTGGAGCGPQDCIPEATLDVAERLVPGIPEAMRTYTMNMTKRSMLNRSAAGIRKDVLIVNLPGKPQAVKECLRYLLPELMQA
ncbi:MAG: MogA/MoaB family molybdenum cofactor biosynthesis protein, partial [Lachnospiraceae bacterium]|nr:MogA/MoaB family molybdenum cofactor biosynthesis protein [Lachnospiraceae bacterium]